MKSHWGAAKSETRYASRGPEGGGWRRSPIGRRGRRRDTKLAIAERS